MSNAYEEAKMLAMKAAREQTCFVPLYVLQELLAEIRGLRAEIERLKPGQAETLGDVVTNLRKPKETA